MASGGWKQPGQHYLQSPASRSFPLRELNRMTEEDAKKLFAKLRWPETDGDPVCPHCGCLDYWDLTNQNKFKCKARECRKQYSITSGTIFSHHKMSFKDMLTGIRSFAMDAKGNTAIKFSKEIGCDYKTAFVFQHKVRESLIRSMEHIVLDGTVEIDGCWVGGYIKPQNVKINRVDRRLLENRNGKRKVVVGMRERGKGGRAIVGVFDSENAAIPWIVDHSNRMAEIMADDAPGWDDLHASHQVGRVNHSQRYADGRNCTNQMESLFSRLRRLEIGTHHHIAGKYLRNYANDTAWRENHRRVDDMSRAHLMLQVALATPQSRSMSGYWQRRRDEEISANDYFANVFSEKHH